MTSAWVNLNATLFEAAVRARNDRCIEILERNTKMKIYKIKKVLFINNDLIFLNKIFRPANF